MNEWREVAIEDLCVRVTSGGTPSRKRPDFYADEGIAWVKSQEIVEAKVTATEEHITDAGLRGSSAKLLPPDTVLMAMYGANVGQLGWLGIEATVNQAICAMVVDPDVTDSRFLYYALAGARANLIAKAHGAAQQNLSQQLIKPFLLRVPDLSTQRQIGDVLRNIDNLIENNQRRAEVLKEMARAIYREWFVKFRYPGHGDVPLVDSALGPIPKNWSVGKIGELCSRVQAGATPRRSTPEYWDEPVVDWYKTGDLTDGVLLGSSEKLSDAGLEAGRTFEPETILMAIYGSPTVGRLGLLTSRASANQAALGLVADPGVCTTEYLWFALESLRGHLNRIAQGAAQQNVSKEKVIGCDVLMPPREVIEDFTLRVAPGWRLSHELARQAAVLESLRDLLLPKLVAGQIDVSMLDLNALIVEQVA